MASKLNLIGRFQHWMDTRTGQMFLNYAYSWGASVVILGALFKLTHIAGANLMLFIGMGTEVVVFFLSGFERPWTEKDIPDDQPMPEDEDSEAEAAATAPEQTVAASVATVGGGTIVIGGGSGVIGATGAAMPSDSPADEPADGAPATVTLSSAGLTPEMEEATAAYVSQLNELTETLKRVAEQSARLTRDSEEMESMNRTLTGINRFYEMQLRSVGQQSGSLDSVNEQTELLAKKLEELNSVYSRMVEALKTRVN